MPLYATLCWLLDMLFHPECGVIKFLWNAWKLVRDFMPLYTRQPYFPINMFFPSDVITRVWSFIILVEYTLGVKVHLPLILCTEELNQ
jgi:hypothetical protein